MKEYNPLWSRFLYIIIFILIFFIYGYQEIIFKRPQSVHQWRQCDCLAFTQTYYQDGNKFFEPKVLYLGNDGSGKTASDFPLIYYSVAQLWKLFGKHEFIYRSIILTFIFVGFFCFFIMTEHILKNSFFAIWITFIMYSSPIVAYYANNFLMNIPAFSLALIALFFFYKFYKKRANKYFYLSMLFYTFAGLLKVTALTSFIAILVVLLLELLKIINEKKIIFFDIKRQAPALLIVIFIVAAWYIYAANYNEKNNSGLFLIGILPIWELDKTQILHIIDYSYSLWLDSYQSIFMQILSAVMFVTLIFTKRKNNTYLWWISVILSFGFLLFVLLWFSVFDNHDYYLINQLIFMMSILVTFFYFLKKNYPKVYHSFLFKGVLLVLLALNISHSKNIIDLRYYGWPNNKAQLYIENFRNIRTYFRNVLKINPKDKVIFIHDPSFNIALYLMEQKGYTDFGTELDDYASVNDKINKGVKYIIINDSSLLQKDYLKPFLYNQIGEFNKLRIFEIKK